MGQVSEPMSRKLPSGVVGGLLALFVLVTLALGSWRGFPVQDDTYMIRLLRMGGPDRVLHEHRDRPVYGFLLTALVRIAGEHRPVYVAAAILFWSLLAAQAVRFWILFFPEWRRAWPAIGGIRAASPEISSNVP